MGASLLCRPHCPGHAATELPHGHLGTRGRVRTLGRRQVLPLRLHLHPVPRHLCARDMSPLPRRPGLCSKSCVGVLGLASAPSRTEGGSVLWCRAPRDTRQLSCHVAPRHGPHAEHFSCSERTDFTTLSSTPASPQKQPGATVANTPLALSILGEHGAWCECRPRAPTGFLRVATSSSAARTSLPGTQRSRGFPLTG